MMIQIYRRLIRKFFGNKENMKYYTLNGILFTIVTIFTKGYAIKFLDRLGGNSFHYSLFNALPGFIAIFTILPGIIMIQKARHKRKILENFFYLSRAFPLLLAIVPFLPEGIRPLSFVLVYGLMNFPESISATALQSFTGDVFAPKDRAEALTSRNSLSQIAQLAFSILVGFVLSMSTTNRGAIITYQVLIVLGFLIGLKEVSFLKKLKETAVESTPEKVHVLESLKGLFGHKSFRSFLYCSLVFHFGWQSGWPLFNLYQITYLGADEKWLTIIAVATAFFSVVSFPFWQKMVKKRGNKFAIILVTFGMGLTPILYAVSETLIIITLMQAVIGFFTAGFAVVMLGSLLEASPPGERLLSTALHATLTSVTLAVAPLIGNVVFERFGIHNAMYFTASLRILGSLTFLIRFLRSEEFRKSSWKMRKKA